MPTGAVRVDASASIAPIDPKWFPDEESPARPQPPPKNPVPKTEETP